MIIGNKKKSVSIIANLLLVCLSLSPLLALELYLRSIDYGYVDKLFVLNKDTDKYEINSTLYQKYFPVDPLVKNSRIPHLFKYKRNFNAKKADNEFRIFCLGGSTTEGAFSDANFPEILGKLLSRSEVNRKIEIVNLGFTTLNSYQVVDFVTEIMDYEPDLLITYMGHNEIYGPLGVASGSQISSSFRLTKTVLYLQRFKLFQLLQNFYLRQLDIDSEEDRTGALFEVMAKSKVPPHSPIRTKALQYFSWNLDKVIGQAEKHNKPLIVMTVASNIRDIRPFDSAVPEDSLLEQWQPMVDSALSLMKQYRNEEAETKFLEAIDIFPDNAQQYYDVGHVYMRLGKKDQALKALTTAKDLDIIPFRAPSGVNEIIKRKVQESSAVLLDVEQIYKKKSANGMIGKPIMVEHLHPSAYGHYLIATGLADIIFQTDLLEPKKKINFTDPAVRTTFEVKINSEDFTETFMWPFTINNKDYRFP